MDVIISEEGLNEDNISSTVEENRSVAVIRRIKARQKDLTFTITLRFIALVYNIFDAGYIYD